MLAARGGWVADANVIDTAYNMGASAYLHANSGGSHLDHEAGHNSSLGGIFRFVGFYERGRPAGGSALLAKRLKQQVMVEDRRRKCSP